MDTPWIFLLTHGGWGNALLESAAMIIGEVQNAESYPLFPLDALKDYMERIEKRILALDCNVILIADLFGGTTSNVAMYMAKKYGVPALSGLDMAVLAAADARRKQEKGEILTREILEAAAGNNRDLAAAVKKEE